jgi:hypothetical protein
MADCWSEEGFLHLATAADDVKPCIFSDIEPWISDRWWGGGSITPIKP